MECHKYCTRSTSTEITLYSTIKSVKTMEIKSQRREYFHLHWSNLKYNHHRKDQKRSLKEPVFSFSICCSLPCWIYNNQFPCPNQVSSFSSLVMSFTCTGWHSYPGACFASVFQEQSPSCVPAFTAIQYNMHRKREGNY